jgi:hypothetical protein
MDCHTPIQGWIEMHKPYVCLEISVIGSVRVERGGATGAAAYIGAQVHSGVAWATEKRGEGGGSEVNPRPSLGGCRRRGWLAGPSW